MSTGGRYRLPQNGWPGFVETPTPGDADALSVIRDDLQDALRRTKQNEPCLRPYRE
jgi:hypothetical protein